MKKCPYCAEEIQDDAIKCRFCNEFILTPGRSKTKWYFSTSIIILALLAVGPFALPLIWFHPNYKKSTKIILTIAIIAITIWLYFLMKDVYFNLKQQLDMLELN